MPEPISDERGFTLVELLAVVAIIGILAGVAIPSFLNQRSKGQDACAKTQLRTMQSTIETIYTESGSYAGIDLAKLTELESSVVTDEACGRGSVAAVGGLSGENCDASLGSSEHSYCLSQTSASGRTYVLTRSDGGAIQRICSPAGGPCNGGSW